MTVDEARLELSADPTSVGAGRRFVRATLLQWGLEDLVDTATLLVSELLTNAVLHARTAPEIVVRNEDNGVRVEVLDGSQRLPVAKGYGVDAATGRGLILLEQLSAAWGAEARGGGKAVWFELEEDGGDEPAEANGTEAVQDEHDLDALLASLGGWEDPPDVVQDRPMARCR